MDEEVGKFREAAVVAAADVEVVGVASSVEVVGAGAFDELPG